jgi:hypothetical protein
MSKLSHLAVHHFENCLAQKLPIHRWPDVESFLGTLRCKNFYP